MSKRQITGMLLLAFIVTSAIVFTTAALGNYGLNWWTAESGGSALSDNGRYKLSGTIGQAGASTQQISNSGEYTLGGGFMYSMLESAPHFYPILLQSDSGYTNIELTWNTTNDPALSGYRISRAISGTAELTVIATISTPLYIDNDPTLVTGTAYCYQIEAIDADGDPFISSNQSCSILGTLEVWIPELWRTSGITAEIPINIKNAEGLPIAQAEIWVEYDCAVIGSPVTVQSSSLTTAYSWSVTESNDGSTCRAQVTTNGGSSPPVLHGEGSLFWLLAPITGTDGDETPLNLREFITDVGGTIIYSPEDDINPIPLILDDGLFHVDTATPYRLGDLNGNGVVQHRDASIALEIANNIVTPTTEQMGAGDVNGDGRITAIDATMILFYYYNQYWPYPNTQINNSEKMGVETAVTASISNASGTPGEIVQVNLTVSDVTDMGGGDFSLVFTENLIDHIISVTRIGIAGDVVTGTQSFNDTDNGLLFFSFANAAPVSSSGAIITIEFEIASDAPLGSSTLLTLASANLNDVNGRDFTTSNLQTTVLRENGLLTIESNTVSDIVVYLPIIVR